MSGRGQSRRLGRAPATSAVHPQNRHSLAPQYLTLRALVVSKKETFPDRSAARLYPRALQSVDGRRAEACRGAHCGYLQSERCSWIGDDSHDFLLKAGQHRGRTQE
jgi:hypothetical protein